MNLKYSIKWTFPWSLLEKSNRSNVQCCKYSTPYYLAATYIKTQQLIQNNKAHTARQWNKDEMKETMMMCFVNVSKYKYRYERLKMNIGSRWQSGEITCHGNVVGQPKRCLDGNTQKCKTSIVLDFYANL